MHFQHRIWESEKFAWDVYPRLLANVGFKTNVAASLMVQEIVRHRLRLLIIV